MEKWVLGWGLRGWVLMRAAQLVAADPLQKEGFQGLEEV